MAWDTAANILNDSAIELGLKTAEITDPYGSTDGNIIQLCRLLKSVGQDLVRDFPWSHLTVIHTLSTADGTASYSLPADFARMVDNTHWNRTQQFPLAGPVNGQAWQLLKAQTSTGVVNKFFRVFGGLIYLHPTPTAIETLAFEYQSTYWVKETGESAPNTETPDAYTDTLYFDRRLLVTALKVAFLRAKGFDSTAAQEDFDKALTRAHGADGAAPVLSLSGRGPTVTRMLDGVNFPETGFGS
jgi:hypothetical protein